MTGEIIHTRPAVADDASTIVEMHRALAEFCNYPAGAFNLSEEQVLDTINNPAHYESYLVAEDSFVEEQEIGGFAYISRTPLSWNGRRGIYIEDLFVWPEFRGNFNIGTSLLAHAAACAIDYADGDADHAYIRLDTAHNNNDATLGFYRSKGFDSHNTNLRMQGDRIKELANLAIITPRMTTPISLASADLGSSPVQPK